MKKEKTKKENEKQRICLVSWLEENYREKITTKTEEKSKLMKELTIVSEENPAKESRKTKKENEKGKEQGKLEARAANFGETVKQKRLRREEEEKRAEAEKRKSERQRNVMEKRKLFETVRVIDWRVGNIKRRNLTKLNP